MSIAKVDISRIIPDEYLLDRDFVLKALELSNTLVDRLSEELLNDSEIAAIVSDLTCDTYDDEDDYKDKEDNNDTPVDPVVLAIRKSGMHKDEFRNFIDNRGIVLQAVTNKGQELKFVSKQLRDDREIVEAAVRNDGSVLLHASRRLRSELEIVSLAVKQNPDCIEYISKEVLLNNRQVIIEVLKRQRRGTIDHLSADLIYCDKEILLLCVQQKPSIFRRLPYEWILEHRDIVLEAVKIKGKSIKYLPISFRSDKEICLEAVKQSGIVYKHLPHTMRLDKILLLEAIRRDDSAFVYYPVALHEQTKDFILEMVRHNGNVLAWIHPNYASDKDIVTEAVKQNGESIKYTTLKLRRNKELMLS
jgi:hypothetical protein